VHSSLTTKRGAKLPDWVRFHVLTILVMRSEGVLKLILNVKLFAGMQCDLEQDRFLRLVAMEPKGLTHFAIKFANATEASTFLKELQAHIPARGAHTHNEE